GVGRAEGWFKEIPSVTDEMVEAFIEEGFLSYTDLTFLEPAQLAELSGLTEDEAEDVISFAEEKAEEVEPAALKASSEESRAAVTQSLKPSAAERAAELLGDVSPTTSEEPKHTVESIFGPDATSKRSKDESRTAAQLLGDAPVEAPAVSTAEPEPAE